MQGLAKLRMLNMTGSRLKRVEEMLKSNPKVAKLFLEGKIARLRFSDGSFFYQLYEFVQIMGAGTFGLVFSARDRRNGELCSIKLLSKGLMRKRDLEAVRTEASALSELSHPNVVKLLGVRSHA